MYVCVCVAISSQHVCRAISSQHLCMEATPQFCPDRVLRLGGVQGHRLGHMYVWKQGRRLAPQTLCINNGVQGHKLAACMCGSRSVGSLHQHCASTLLHCSIIQRTGLCMHVVLISRLHDTVGCVACCMLGCGLHWLADRYV